MKIKMLFSLILVAIMLALPVSAQQSEPSFTKQDLRISKDKPTVYITFEHAGPREGVYASESGQGIWLRLHNNTKWAISFSTLSLYIGEKIAPLRLGDGRNVLGLREGVEISPCHGVEVVDRYEFERTVRKTDKGETQIDLRIDENAQVPNPPVGYNIGGHIIATSWLASGRSIIFSVPREHLAKRLAIYLSFMYEWQTAERANGSIEPQIRVYFRAADLPKSVVEK
ncbi:MAG: hypothetical protein ABI882_11990 [Acidobacteriota bacterium]